ncbi:MAG: DUF1499 domain-containing protein [Synechococcaceae bacterium WB5_2A_257]|nr:DUF1499 domain-containing protein [Synechococcaceae bacterium WB5_2A_257]
MNFLINCIILLSLSLFQFVGPEPTDLGVHNAELSPCASPAHCARANWPVAKPIDTLNELVPLLEKMLEQDNGYIHATVSSALFGFVDDLELYADPIRGFLQARSVSRLGDSDLGVNAKRLTEIYALIPQFKDL